MWEAFVGVLVAAGAFYAFVIKNVKDVAQADHDAALNKMPELEENKNSGLLIVPLSPKAFIFGAESGVALLRLA